MKKSRLEIFVGTRGWQYSDWLGDFYPDDLPEDWRFSYYSNEQQAILVPFDYLHRYTEEEWAEWVEDTPNEFAFYVELSGSASWNEVSSILEVIGKQLKGIVIVIDDLPDIEAFASLVRHAKVMAPVCIQRVGDKVSEQDMETLRSCHEVNECWNGENDAPVWGYGGAAVLLRDSGKQNSPDILRQLIEKGIEYAGTCEAIALFFTGDAPKISDIRNARTITELMV
ncbi:hypothetical protein [Kaarinaea lacus]